MFQVREHLISVLLKITDEQLRVITECQKEIADLRNQLEAQNTPKKNAPKDDTAS